MGVTYTVDDSTWDGGTHRRVVLTAQFDASYTSGGETLAPDDAGLQSIDSVVIQEPVTENGYVASYRAGDGTIKMFTSGGGGSPLSEVADATDLSTESATVVVRGRS